MSVYEKVKAWKGEEKGSPSTIAVILLMPLLVAAFGFGYDIVRLQYVTSWLNKKAMFAVEAGSANLFLVSRTNGLGQDVSLVRLRPNATQVAANSYLTNTASYRRTSGVGAVLLCTRPSITPRAVLSEDDYNVSLPPVGTPSNCTGSTYQLGRAPSPDEGSLPFCTAIGNNSYGVGLTVNEQVQYSFLPIVGISRTTVVPKAVDYVRYRTC